MGIEQRPGMVRPRFTRRVFSEGAIGVGLTVMVGATVDGILAARQRRENLDAVLPTLAAAQEADREIAIFHANNRKLAKEGRLDEIPLTTDAEKIREAIAIYDARVENYETAIKENDGLLSRYRHSFLTMLAGGMVAAGGIIGLGSAQRRDSGPSLRSRVPPGRF